MKKKFRMREIYVTWIDTTVEANSREEAEIILECLPRDHDQIDNNKMFQQEELEEVDPSTDLTPITTFDKQFITNELGYEIYEGITPQKTH